MCGGIEVVGSGVGRGEVVVVSLASQTTGRLACETRGRWPYLNSLYTL